MAQSVVVLLMALVFVGPTIFGLILVPDHRFGDKPLPDAPDYSLRAHWSAWPDDASPAERRPDGVPITPQEERLADAFFLHPTSYGGTDHWVQPMDDEQARRGTDLGTVSRQASAFSGCCRVYAPRFRQSNIMGYQEEDIKPFTSVGLLQHLVDPIATRKTRSCGRTAYFDVLIPLLDQSTGQ